VATAISSPQRIRVNGQFVDVAAYNIKGFNFFRLRDLAIMLDFEVVHDPESGRITIDPSKPYNG
jgi:hypothetical protein